MGELKFAGDRVVRRLRWVMIGVMLFGMAATLLGQPASYWLHPATAIRGDGLSVFNPVNHSFDFLIHKGWQIYLLVCAAYLALTFLLVSVLPKKLALATIFSFIFGHYFAIGCRLSTILHLGFFSPFIFGFVLALAVVSAGFDTQAERVDKQLRWLMIAVMALDGLGITLIGQPSSYWLHPETVREGNPLVHYLLSHSLFYFFCADFAYLGLAFLLVSALPRVSALVAILAFIFGHFMGASSWLFYDYRLGIEAPVLYGVAISAVLVALAFHRRGGGNRLIIGDYALLDRDGLIP